MGSAKLTYDPELRKSDHGRRIYCYWKKARKDTDAPEFVEFQDFYKWAMANGYTLGAKLLRHDESKPYSPDNCFFYSGKWLEEDEKETTRNPEWEKKWDDTVNIIRQHFGMEPIHSSEV